jgi:pilus assembly protein CpaB
MKSRLLILAAALVLGLIAAVVAGSYLRSASVRLTKDAEPVQVLVATQDIPKGTPADDLLKDGLLEVQEVPRRYVSDGAVSSAQGIQGQVLAVGLSKGEQVTKARFQFPGEAGLSYGIPEGFVAVSIAADDVTCVGGMLKPGDNVMVVSTFDPGPNGKEAETRVLLGKAKVLAVNGQTETSAPAAEEGGATLTGSTRSRAQTAPTITLALPPGEVEKLVFAEEQGSVWLSLLPATETDLAETAGRTIKTIFK